MRLIGCFCRTFGHGHGTTPKSGRKNAEPKPLHPPPKKEREQQQQQQPSVPDLRSSKPLGAMLRAFLGVVVSKFTPASTARTLGQQEVAKRENIMRIEDLPGKQFQ